VIPTSDFQVAKGCDSHRDLSVAYSKNQQQLLVTTDVFDSNTIQNSEYEQYIQKQMKQSNGISATIVSTSTSKKNMGSQAIELKINSNEDSYESQIGEQPDRMSTSTNVSKLFQRRQLRVTNRGTT